MNTQDQELERAIQLLQSLIERSPSATRSRIRLLSLLHANDNKTEFLLEAQKYKENCDLTFDADWIRICDMGQEMDPNNGLFRASSWQPVEQEEDIALGTDNLSSDRNVSACGKAAPAEKNNTIRSVDILNDGNEPVGVKEASCVEDNPADGKDALSDENDSALGADAPEGAADDSDGHRSSEERRKQDRRMAITAWYGEERRNFPRRQKVRRGIDISARKKK